MTISVCFLSQATMLNSHGSPWAVRWFPVAEAKLYRAARVSNDTLNFISNFSQIDNSKDSSKNAIVKTTKSNHKDGDFAIHMTTVAFVGLLGLAIGRYSQQ